MPETNSKPKNIIPATVLIETAKGNYKNDLEGLYFLSGKELLSKKLPSVKYLYIHDDEQYLLLDNVEIVGAEGLYFTGLCKDGKPVFNWLIYNSDLPHLFFENSMTADIDVYENSTTGNIRIYGNSLIGNITISEKSTTGFIGIYENSTAGNLAIFEDSTTGNITIYGDSTMGNISIDYNSSTEQITINKNSTTGGIEILNNSKTEHIAIYENSKTEEIRIADNSKTRDIDIFSNSKTGNIGIYNSTSALIEISDSYASLYFDNATVSKINITKSHIQELQWETGSRGELYISDSSINHFNLTGTALLKDSIFSITNTQVYILEMDTLLVQGQLLLRNIEAISKDNLTEISNDLLNRITDNSSNRAKHVIQNLKDKFDKSINDLTKEFNGPTFIIANSSLAKTEITGSDLTGFKIEYRDSKLLECFLSGTKLDAANIGVFESVDKKDHAEQKAAIYNQLRKLYESVGDIVQAGKYQERAMSSQQKLLELETKGDRWFSENRFDLFTFRLNKWSNKHGESWKRALAFTLLLSLAVYSCYYASLFYQQSFSSEGIEDFFGDYFSFLDITHKPDFIVPKEKLTALNKFIDFLGRILVVYCFYQFVAAFRRHGRKAI